MEIKCLRYALENPVGILGTAIRPADQIIQPHEFGDDASKGTCLWLKGLPKLIPTGSHPPRIVELPIDEPQLFSGNAKLVKRWGNHTDSGQNKLPPSDKRKELRSNTYPGVAAAMAAQWGKLLT